MNSNLHLNVLPVHGDILDGLHEIEREVGHLLGVVLGRLGNPARDEKRVRQSELHLDHVVLVSHRLNDAATRIMGQKQEQTFQQVQIRVGAERKSLGHKSSSISKN